MRKVPIEMLTPDMVLARSIFQNRALLIGAGTKELQMYADKFAALGIRQLYIEDMAGEGIEIPDAISEKTRLQCKDTLYDTFHRFHKQGFLDTEEVSEVLENVLDEILSNKDILISLGDIGTTDDATLTHSVNTTIYALTIANSLNYSRHMLQRLAEGAILHDIGKTCVSSKILYKKGKLSPEEFEHIKTHTLLGYEALKLNYSLTETSRQIVLYHHERLDGSGYPKGLKGDEIPEFAKIVAIADIYDALTAERCYRPSWSNVEAIEQLTRDALTGIDAKLTRSFINNLAIYPNGSIVKLSNGEYGVIKEQNRGLPYNPIVRIIEKKDNVHVPKGEVDLSKVLNLTVVETGILKL